MNEQPAVKEKAAAAEDAQSFAELFAESMKGRNLREGDPVRVKVQSVTEDYVMVNAGLKSESKIPVEEFMSDEGNLEVAEGDFVDVEIAQLENGMGETVLSRADVRRRLSWQRIEEAKENDQPIEGVVKDRIKGGYSVMVEGVRAFLPGSLVDVFPQKDPAALLNTKQEFLIVTLQRKRSSLVVSRRAVIERAMSKGEGDGYAQYREGAVLKGKVHGVTDYGAFVDIGNGVYGLLHITDLAWRRVRNVTDVVNVGDEVEVKVMKVDMERRRISLGMKQLTPDPWRDFDRRHPEGSRMYGKVVSIAAKEGVEYGAFVEVEGGVEGLLHASEMEWSRKSVTPSQVVRVGDEVEVMVLKVDKENARLSLGMKQCRDNPWHEFASAYRKGSRLKAKVRTITEFGVFVELPGDIDGLVHISDLSNSEPGEKAIRHFNKGDEVEVVVLSVDAPRERIGLGIKQLDDEHYSRYLAEHLKNTVVKGTILSLESRGARVRLTDNVHAFLPIGEVAEERVEDISQYLSEGVEREFVLVNADNKTMQITLSLKAKNKMEREDESARAAAESSGTSLGAMLKAKLAEAEEEEGAGDSDSGADSKSDSAAAADSAAESDSSGDAAAPDADKN